MPLPKIQCAKYDWSAKCDNKPIRLAKHKPRERKKTTCDSDKIISMSSDHNHQFHINIFILIIKRCTIVWISNFQNRVMIVRTIRKMCVLKKKKGKKGEMKCLISRNIKINKLWSLSIQIIIYFDVLFIYEALNTISYSRTTKNEDEQKSIHKKVIIIW